MSKKIGSGEFIALSASSMMLTALGIDIMLPVFGEIRRHFGLPPSSTEPAQIIVFFFMGQIVQVLFGALSDRFGRLAILRIGFPLYMAGGLAASFAPSLPAMLAARFLAGVGASAVMSTTIAGVRDRYVGDAMARTLSLIFTIFLFTPVIAPFLGIAILRVASWRLVFLTPPIFAALVFLWSFRLDESLPADRRLALPWTAFGRSVRDVLTNRTFLRYTFVTSLLFTGLSTYVSSSEHIVGEIYHRPALFPWIFAGMGAFMVLCTLVNSRLSIRYGARKTLRGLIVVYSVVAALLLACTLLSGDPPDMVAFFVLISVLMGTNLAIEPNSSAMALEPMGDHAGLASSVYGTIFFFVGASLSALIGRAMTEHVLPLSLSYFLIGLAALGLVYGDRRKREA